VPALFFYGVKWITWVTHVPFCPGLEHKVIVARISCPIGSYVKAGALTVRVAPGGKASFVFEVRQPLISVKLSAYMERTVSVTLSLTVREKEWKETPPVFSRSISTHQPAHVSVRT
jgi:hypothetical protein